MAIDFTIHAEGMRWNIPPVSLVTEINTRRMMSKPRNVTNFPTDELGWYVKAIERCGYPGFYIEKDAYDICGNKLPDDYALMVVGDYNMTKFWNVFREMRAMYTVCPEVSIQDVVFGQSAECLQLIDEMRREMLHEITDERTKFPTSGEEAFQQMLNPQLVDNFPVDKLGLYVEAIKRCGHPGVYIEKDAYAPAGCKLPDHYALMVVGGCYVLPCNFFEILDAVKRQHPVCPEVSLQDVIFGQSAECLKLIENIKTHKKDLVEAFDKALRQWNNA